MSIRPNKTIALLTVTKKWKWPKWWTSLISGEVNCGISIQWESIQPLKGMKWYLLWCGWILQIVVVVQSLSHVLPNKLQNARLPCLSLSFRVCSNSCPLSWWYYLTLSSNLPLTHPSLRSHIFSNADWAIIYFLLEFEKHINRHTNVFWILSM